MPPSSNTGNELVPLDRINGLALAGGAAVDNPSDEGGRSDLLVFPRGVLWATLAPDVSDDKLPNSSMPAEGEAGEDDRADKEATEALGRSREACEANEGVEGDGTDLRGVEALGLGFGRDRGGMGNREEGEAALSSPKSREEALEAVETLDCVRACLEGGLVGMLRAADGAGAKETLGCRGIDSVDEGLWVAMLEEVLDAEEATLGRPTGVDALRFSDSGGGGDGRPVLVLSSGAEADEKRQDSGAS